ncbi:hypothetical protein P9112_002680 [Eukaryota sp. TZLM1-RC]
MSDFEDDHVSSVVAHYTARATQNDAGRVNTRSLAVRRFNNWVKFVTISEAINTIKGRRKFINPDILDYCGGMGGDLMKWTRARARSYVLVDVVESSVREALGRRRRQETKHSLYAKRQKQSFMEPSAFVVADAGKDSLDDVLPPDCWFDIVSCQFAAHYMFDYEHRAKMFFKNASCRLRIGGIFIMTIPNANYIVKKTRENLQDDPHGFVPPPAMVEQGFPPNPAPGFGSNLYGVVFPEHVTLKKYGTPYTFWLADAIDCCEEYLIHEKEMENTAQDYGFELIQNQPFTQLLESHYSAPSFIKNKLQDMKVFDTHDDTLSQDAWELAHFYSALMFKKVRKTSPHESKAAPFSSLNHLGLYKCTNNRLEELPADIQPDGTAAPVNKTWVYELQQWEIGPQDDWNQKFEPSIPDFDKYLPY